MSTDDLDTAASEVEAAERTMYAAEARREVCALGPGLWTRPLDPESTRYVVGHDGAVIGEVVPAQPGQVLGGWTAYRPDGAALPAKYHTSRAAAAALAVGAP